MQFPLDMDAKSQSLIIALSFRFAKNKPGLEQNDLINEALIKFQEIKNYYDPANAARTAFTTVLYGAVRNHFLNMHNHYKNSITASAIEVNEIEDRVTIALQASITEHIDLLRTRLTEPVSKLLLDKLIAQANAKTTIKDICADLDISFFRYQQAEHKIRYAIKKLTL